LFCGVPVKAIAQDIDEDFFKYHLAQNVYPIDSEASAVVLYEKNTCTVGVGNDGNYTQTFQVYKIIKILKPDAFDCANILDDYRHENDMNSYIDEVKGTTYNLVGDQVVETKLSKSDVYRTTMDDRYSRMTFSMPAIKEGSIIEYSYEKVSPDISLLPEWDIQGSYPKLRSIYALTYPLNFAFTTLTQLRTPFVTYKSENNAEIKNAQSYYVVNDGLDANSLVWVKRNIDATKEEPYSSDVANNKERMEVQLTKAAINGTVKSFSNTWERLDDELWRDNNMGKQLTASNTYLDKVTDSLTKSCTSEIDKAKAIFKYVRSNFTANDTKNIYKRKPLSNVFKDKGGSEAEINLLLIAMMRNVGLNSSPVFLSTTGRLSVSKLYPIIDRFNYIICAVQIDTDRILLDASDKFNSFYSLPYYCYNGYARLVDKQADDVMLTADKATENERIFIQMKNISDSAMDVTVMEKLGNASSAKYRSQWSGDKKDFDSYVKEETQSFAGTVSISESEMRNLDNPDTSLGIAYTFHIKSDKHNDQYFLNTDFIKFFKTNPFQAMERKLPIAFPYKVNYMYSLNVQLPNTFKLEEVPKSIIIKYADEDVVYKKLANYNEDMHSLTVNTYFTINTTKYPVDSYKTLRQFFDRTIQEENEIISLKKISDK